MKNIILSNDAVVELIAKVYADGSIKLIEKWHNKNLMKKIFFLTTNEAKILKENI